MPPSEIETELKDLRRKVILKNGLCQLRSDLFVLTIAETTIILPSRSNKSSMQGLLLSIVPPGHGQIPMTNQPASLFQNSKSAKEETMSIHYPTYHIMALARVINLT